MIERVTEMSNWSSRNGRFLGLAAHRSFVSYTAVVLSVVVVLSLITSGLIVWLYVDRRIIRRLTALSHIVLPVA